MHGWIDEMMDGWMYWWVEDGWMDVRVDGWTGGWMDVWMDV
jgi:hypothetical protein